MSILQSLDTFFPFFCKQKSKQMAISHSKKFPSGIIAMTLAILISPADAQTSSTSCTSTSPQCCWVKRSWDLMGKTTAYLLPVLLLVATLLYPQLVQQQLKLLEFQESDAIQLELLLRSIGVRKVFKVLFLLN